MKAIGFTTSLPITDTNSFFEFEATKPQPTGRDLLVKIKAIGINPVDYKIRQNSAVNTTLESPKIIGWDAVGVVEAIGSEVKDYIVGDEVFYAGDLTRPGCYAEYQLVDERIVGHKPYSLSHAEAAAMPLTTLTAWELLFDRLQIKLIDLRKSILIVGGAGGVGSIAIQLAKRIGHLQVIATASRPETIAWCQELGADYVVNHHNLLEEMHNIGFDEVDYILDLVDASAYWETFAKLIKPQGKIGSISDPKQPVDLTLLKPKSASFHWEFMYTRSMHQTTDIKRQQEILNHTSELFNEEVLKSTLKQTYTGFSVDNIKAAHQLQESGKAIGKNVIIF